MKESTATMKVRCKREKRRGGECKNLGMMRGEKR